MYCGHSFNYLYAIKMEEIEYGFGRNRALKNPSDFLLGNSLIRLKQ